MPGLLVVESPQAVVKQLVTGIVLPTLEVSFPKRVISHAESEHPPAEQR